jgi:chloramphenicol 3-O-phosphotransferase
VREGGPPLPAQPPARARGVGGENVRSPAHRAAGAGKTVTLIAPSDALIDDGIAHAAVDVDEVAWAYPFPSLEQRCEHLRAWAAPHLEAGHELLLVSEVLESAAHTSAVLSALGADDRLLVWLDAPTSTMRRRVSAREPEGRSGLPRMPDEIPKLRAALAELADIDLVLDSEQVEPPELARRIRTVRPDKLGG